MRLFIDGDAFPNALKPIILKAINKRALETIVVSNKKVSIGESKYVTYEIVELGIDGADNHIVDIVKEGDFVITADIPLADKCVSKGALGLDHRGELFCEDNIKSLLAMRNLMAEIRDSGEMTRGPKPFSKKDAEAFANGLYRFLDRC
jgi:uncharacterized protein YaiI (UPF0178 family)